MGVDRRTQAPRLAAVRSEERHPEADERFRGLLEAIPAVIYEAEPRADGAWHYVSGYVETLLGYAPQDFVADPLLWASRIHPDDREAVLNPEQQQLEAARDGDVTIVTEYRLLHRDGHAVWVRDLARVTGDPRRPVWQGVFVDISAERALAEAYHRYRGLTDATATWASEEASNATDVYRLSCQQCGSVWAAERLEPCRRCGNRRADAVSLDETLHELAGVRSQLEGLLEGIQGHLETLRSTLGARPDAAPREAAPDGFWVIQRGDP